MNRTGLHKKSKIINNCNIESKVLNNVSQNWINMVKLKSCFLRKKK